MSVITKIYHYIVNIIKRETILLFSLLQTAARTLLNVKLSWIIGPKKLKPTNLMTYDTGWKKVHVWGRTYIEIDRLTARLKSERGLRLSGVQDTPHFAYANKATDIGADQSHLYIDYIRTHFPENCLKDRTINFEWIINQSRKPDQQFGPILVKPKLFPRRELVIIDGLHRCSASLAAGRKDIEVYLAL